MLDSGAVLEMHNVSGF